MIDPIALRILVAVHDTGSVRGAADLLGYTSPNVTQHLRKLERRLGEPMVERAGRGLVMTPRGVSLVERARPLIDGLEQLDLTSTSEVLSGVVRIAAFPTALRGLLLPAMAAMNGAHPELTIVPIESDPAGALDALGVGRLDAVISKSWGTTEPATGARRPLTRIEIGRDHLDAVVPAGHPLADRHEIGLRDLAAERWAITPPGDPFGTWISAHAPALLHPIINAFHAVEFQSLIRFAETGLAITVVPRLGRGALPDAVVAIPLNDADAFRAIDLYVRPMAARSRATEMIVERFRTDLAT